MKYKLTINSYELTLLKYLVYERQHFLRNKLNEVPKILIPGIKMSYDNSKKLLNKLCRLSKNISDFYNYDLLERNDKSYNELIKEYFNAKS